MLSVVMLKWSSVTRDVCRNSGASLASRAVLLAQLPLPWVCIPRRLGKEGAPLQ